MHAFSSKIKSFQESWNSVWCKLLFYTISTIQISPLNNSLRFTKIQQLDQLYANFIIIVHRISFLWLNNFFSLILECLFLFYCMYTVERKYYKWVRWCNFGVCRRCNSGVPEFKNLPSLSKIIYQKSLGPICITFSS